MKRGVFLLMGLALCTGPTYSQASRISGHGSSHAIQTGVPTAALPDLRRYAAFDGIEIANHARFWEDWRLVTVRYRSDNGEQRFVYANALAWEAMKAKKRVYPDGAMFGKIAFSTASDPAFPNSVQPLQYTRIQLMQKNSRKYGKSDGWGYAIIFAGSGPPYRDEKVTGTACHACHQMVAERNFVFSQPAFLSGARSTTSSSASLKSQFRLQESSQLSSFERNALTTIRRLDPSRRTYPLMALSMTLFPGSVDESIGALSRFASDDNAEYALWDSKSRQFVIARPLIGSDKCKQKALVVLTVTPSRENSPAIPRSGTTCNGVWRPLSR